MFKLFSNKFKTKKFYIKNVEIEKVCQGFVVKAHTKRQADCIDRYLKMEGFKDKMIDKEDEIY